MNEILKIPNKFNLFGHIINVQMVKDLVDEDNNLGEAIYGKNLIKIQENGENFQRPQSEVEKNFIHELVHWILYMMNESELRNNEKFVDIFARLLHQAMKTAEY